MKDYLIWLADKIETKLGVDYNTAMQIATTTNVSYFPGYLVGDYLEERDTPTITSWPDIEAEG